MRIKTALAAGLMAMALTTPAFAQEEQPHPMGGMMMKEDGMMMQMHQKMEAAWKIQDAELDALITQMKSASGDQKMTTMEAVLSKLVELRKEEHKDMLAMHDKMQNKMHEKMQEKAATSPSPQAHSEH